MERLLSFGLVLGMLACTPLDFSLGHQHRNEVVSSGGTRQQKEQQDSLVSTSDTLIYLAAIEVPTDYDWVRDSCYGAVKARAMLLQNGQELVSFGVGSGSNANIIPDSYHLFGGHLYTEFYDNSQTYILKDGSKLLQWDGREVLKGMLVEDEGIITLGLNRDNGMYYLRKDGAILTQVSLDRVFGDFNNFAYGRTGALYRDGGKFYFCGQKGKSLYIVESGEPSMVSPPFSNAEMLDFKIVDGQARYLGKAGSYAVYRDSEQVWRLSIDDGGIVMLDEEIYAIGSRSGRITLLNTDDGESKHIYGDLSLAYINGNSLLTVGNLKENELMLSLSCGQNLNGRLYKAISRRNSSPILVAGKDSTEIGINGFLAGVEVIVNQPNE